MAWTAAFISHRRQRQESREASYGNTVTGIVPVMDWKTAVTLVVPALTAVSKPFELEALETVRMPVSPDSQVTWFVRTSELLSA